MTYIDRLNLSLRLAYGLRWRRRHPDMPTVRQITVLALAVILVAFGLARIAINHELMAARDDVETSTRILGCINGQNSLGRYVENGVIWEVFCTTIERKVRL